MNKSFDSRVQKIETKIHQNEQKKKKVKVGNK